MTDTLDSTAVEAVAKLAREAAGPFTVQGREFYAGKRLDLAPGLPEAVTFHTLAGFADFILSQWLPTDPAKPIVQIVDHRGVRALGPLVGPDGALRACYAEAEYNLNLRGFAFDRMGTLEGLNIALQTCFAPDRGQILELQKFCAAVRATEEVGTDDDGVSQTVQAKRGIAAIQNTKVTNPWALAPWRTFPEIVQPTSPYVLRFQENRGSEPMAGLFETGDGRWQLEAVGAIAFVLRERLGKAYTVLA